MALVVLGWRKRSNLESRQMLGILCSSAISQLKDHFRSSRRIDPKAVKTTTPPVHMRRPGLLPGSGFCFERRWEVWYRGWTRLHIRKNDRLSSSLEKLNAFDLKQMKSHCLSRDRLARRSCCFCYPLPLQLQSKRVLRPSRRRTTSTTSRSSSDADAPFRETKVT